MGLISICSNDKCWQRFQCYRWAQFRKPGDVCTHIEVPTPTDGEPCEYFDEILPHDRLRKEVE